MWGTAFKILIRSKYTRRKINIITVVVMSYILRNILDILAYLAFRVGHTTIDLIISIIITVLISLISGFITSLIVLLYEKSTLRLTSLVIDNLTIDNIRRVKNYILLICGPVLLTIIYTNIIDIK